MKSLPKSRHSSELSPKQRRDIESFMHIFSDVETALKGRLGLAGNNRTPMSKLIDLYAAANPYWVDSAQQLRTLSEIRNLLAHQRGLARGFPIAVTPGTIDDIHQIAAHLQRPEPVAHSFRKPVLSVRPTDTLATVLGMAFDNGFSQFPVIEGSDFRGLITENEMVRWFGRAAKASRTVIDLTAIPVRNVLRERDPAFRDIATFCFAKPEDPVEEIVGRFIREPALEVVLISANGRKDTQLEGIITQWDAARFRG